MEKISGGLFIEPVEAKNLTDTDFAELCDVSREMWSDPKSLGELVQCQACGKVSSKKDIFGHLDESIYMQTVGKIMKLLELTDGDIDCPCCHGSTKMTYGSENIIKIRRRLLGSMQSFLVVCRNMAGEIVGYEDAYIDSLKNIFEGELTYHYSDVGINEIAGKIAMRLGYEPKELIAFSSIGFISRYQSAGTLFRLMQNFARILPEERMDDLPGIAEVDRRNAMYNISLRCGGISLGITDDPILSKKIQNTNPGYQSDLMLYRDPIRQHKTKFNTGTRRFIAGNSELVAA